MILIHSGELGEPKEGEAHTTERGNRIWSRTRLLVSNPDHDEVRVISIHPITNGNHIVYVAPGR
jgi:hypothetical protein